MKNYTLRLIFFAFILLPFFAAPASASPNIELVIVDVGSSANLSIHPRFDVSAAETSVDDISVSYTVDNPAGLTVSPASIAVFKKVKTSQLLHVTGLQYGIFTIRVHEYHHVFASDTSTQYGSEEVDYNVVIHVVRTKDLLLHSNQVPSGSASVSRMIAGLPGVNFSTVHFFYTFKAVYKSAERTQPGVLPVMIYIAPPSLQIIDVKSRGVKMVEAGSLGALEWTQWELVILLDDGTAVIVPVNDNLDADQEITIEPNPKSNPQEVFKKICGDDLYTISDKGVYRLRNDSTAQWEFDTSGLSLGANSPADIIIDTAQNVYTAIGNTVFTQAHTEIAWHSISTIPANVNVLYVDRRNRFFSGTGGTGGKNGVYHSTDLGRTWQLGNSGMDDKGIYALGDDAYGNIYAVTDTGEGTGIYGERIYRSSDGGMNWTRIDQPITAQFFDVMTSGFYNAVNGDSLLFCSTTSGVFTSSDQGTTWQLDEEAVASESMVGYLQVGNAQLVSGLQGIGRTTTGDSLWNHVYPIGGLVAGTILRSDNNGTAWMLTNFTDQNQVNAITIKSTDNGATWNADTAGLFIVPLTDIFCVDEFGNQHVPGFVKPAGSPWQVETINIAPIGQYAMIKSDREGDLYLSSGNPLPSESGILIRRPISGGAWSLDTAGLGGALITDIVHDNAKQIFAVSYSGNLFTKVGSSWTALPSPLPAKIYGGFISADSSGAIIVTGWYVASNYSLISNGVWVSKDKGMHWRSAGLDSIYIPFLVSYGDSTFCLSDGGIYVIHSTFAPKMQVVTPDTIDFGDVLLGRSRDTTFQIANFGTDPLHISDISSSSALFSVKTKSYTIDTDSWVTDSIHFAPGAAGPASSIVNVTGDGGVGKKIIVKANGTAQKGVKITAEDGYSLEQNNPNPFSTSTTIRYKIPDYEHVRLTLLDAFGDQHTMLFEGEADSGEHELVINARDLASGVYAVRMEAGGVTKSQKICVMK